MFAPDHWIPLLVVSSRSNYSRRKTYMTAAALGFLHASSSIAVALVAFSISLSIAKEYVMYFRSGAELLLLIIAGYFILNGISEKNSVDSGKHVSNATLLSVSVFPDLAFMPLLISGIGLSTFQISAIILTFGTVSTFSMVFVVFFAMKGFLKAVKNIPPRYMDDVIAAILIVTFAYLYFF